MKRQWIGREIDDGENDDPNPGPSTRANHAKRGRKPKLPLSPKKPSSKRRIKFTEGLNTSQGPMDHWLLRKMKSIVDLKEEIIEDILNPPEELPNITANNSFNGTNESEETIKDNEVEKNIEMEIVEIGQPDENMEMEVDEGQEKAKEKVNKRKEVEPPAQIYTDREGNEWSLLGPSGYLQVHYPLLGMEKCFETPKSSIYKCVHRYQQKCPHLMLMLKKKKLFYQRFEHSHQMEMTLADLLRGKTPSPKKVGPDVDLVNKMELDRWKCIDPAIASEEKLEQIIKDQGMRRACAPNEIFQKFVCKEGRCGFKMRWLKRRSELWSIGEHNRHPRVVQRKLKRKKKREDKWPAEKRKVAKSYSG